MKILMIGLGSIGQRHLRNIKRVYGEEAQILAYRVRGLKRTFSDTMQIRENVSLEEEYNIKSFDDLSKALLEKPDIAYITNITKSHIPCAIACAKAGCHLFLEKPISDSLDGIEELAKIAEVDIETHAKNMFRAGSNFKNKTIKEIFFQDFKKFTAADKDFGVGQISAMGAEELLGIKDQIVAYMDTVLTEKKLNMVFIMLTDILEETTYLLCAGTGADQVAEEAFKQEKDGDYYVLKGVVSRKKQIIPPFMSVLQ